MSNTFSVSVDRIVWVSPFILFIRGGHFSTREAIVSGIDLEPAAQV